MIPRISSAVNTDREEYKRSSWNAYSETQTVQTQIVWKLSVRKCITLIKLILITIYAKLAHIYQSYVKIIQISKYFFENNLQTKLKIYIYVDFLQPGFSC